MKKVSRLFAPSIWAVVLLMLVAAGSSRADTITWTNINGGNWSSAANWDPNQVPSTNDTALITLAGPYTVSLDISITVSNLTLGGDSGVQTLAINGATLTISGSGSIASNGVIYLADGALNNTGPLTVEGALLWSGGSLGGALNIASNGLLRTSGTGGNLLYFGGAFNNAGTVDAQSGTLTIWSLGTNSGRFNAESNAVIEFRGASSIFLPAPSFISGSSFTGPGRKRLIGGYITLDGSLFAQNLDFAGAYLLGDCTLT